MAKIQRLEKAKTEGNPEYKPRVRIAIVTARNAPAHERVVTSLRKWGIEVDQVFFLGGVEKAKVWKYSALTIFLDDQITHIKGAAGVAPSAHVPFGIANQAADKLRKLRDQICGMPAGA